MNRWYDNVLTNKMGKAVALKEVQQWVRNLRGDEFSKCAEQYLPKDPDTDEDSDTEKIISDCKRKTISAHKRTAKLRPPFAHPYYWGAFTCNGNWM